MKYYIQESNKRLHWSKKNKEVQDTLLHKKLSKIGWTMPPLSYDFEVYSENELSTILDIFSSAGYDLYLYQYTGEVKVTIPIEYFESVLA